jgi:hypothetical protein
VGFDSPKIEREARLVSVEGEVEHDNPSMGGERII